MHVFVCTCVGVFSLSTTRCAIEWMAAVQSSHYLPLPLGVFNQLSHPIMYSSLGVYVIYRDEPLTRELSLISLFLYFVTV